MVFGLFTRKSTLEASPGNQTTRLPTPTPSITGSGSPSRFPTTLRSVFSGSTTDLTLKGSDQATDSIVEDTHFPAPPPPATPSPPPTMDPSETKILYDLMLTIPPKTLHAYTLAHLRPQQPLPSITASSPALGLHIDNTPRPPSPNTVSKLTGFFSTLAPPPLLHCMRCHKDFHEIENEEKDKACRVAHDDESTIVSRVSGGGGYETLWACCGQTASGDGSEGPPDGWCYEGRHTTDAKRARFRADSTMHNDKLTSCLKLNCHGIRDRLPHALPVRNLEITLARRSNPSPVRSQVSISATHSTRKRTRKSLKEASVSENESDAKSTTKAKDEVPKEGGGGSAGDKDANMAIDEPDLKSKSKPKAKIRSQPISRANHLGTSTTVSPLKSNPLPLASPAKARTSPVKPKSLSRTLLSQSHTHLASDSEASTRSRPRTRSHIQEESRVRPMPKSTRVSISERKGRSRRATRARSESNSPEEVPETELEEQRESDEEERGRNRKRRRVGRG